MNITNHIERRLYRQVKCVGFYLALFVITGCASPNVDLVRQAQDNYNRAAQLDNQSRLFTGYRVEDQDIVKRASINSMYASVVTSIEGLKPEAVQQVKADGLWGNLLTIKAISEWRLGRYPQAATTAEKALSFTQGILPRDQVIAEVMSHLIRNDQAKNFVDLHQNSIEFSYDEWLNQVQHPLEKVLNELPVAAKKWQERGRIQIATYLKMNEVIAFINLRDGFVKLNPCATSSPTQQIVCKALEQEKTQPAQSNKVVEEYARMLLQATGDRCKAKQDELLINTVRKLGLALPAELAQSC